MKKYPLFLLLLLILSNCIHPEGRSWIIPLTIDDAMLVYTPEQIEGFEKRRADVLQEMEPGYMILKSSDQQSYNLHQYRTNNYFYYLSGFESYNSYLILSKNEEEAFLLTMPEKNMRQEIYMGKQPSAEEIQSQYHADSVLSFKESREFILSILGSGKAIYVDRHNRELMDELGELAENYPEVEFRNAAPILDEKRVIKEPMELDRMQKACNITALSLTRVMHACEAEMHEFEMEAIIEGCYLEYGSGMPGFPSIVGSGPNSTTLHYEQNTRIMKDGDLLLMDIGADYGYYTADISRTIPVNGKFSTEQRAIYQLVLNAQHAGIEEMKPGKGVRDGHWAAREVMGKGLAELGLVTDIAAEWQLEFYCIHGSSHYLGMDVHDVGYYENDPGPEGDYKMKKTGSGRLLEPGMVLTIEPGIYIRENGLEQLDAMLGSKVDSSEIVAFTEAVRPIYDRYLHIGVRIEDDILITKEGNLVLSRYAPKEIDDIEQLMRLRSSSPR
jgi:Xaa-Pro aminopeptidase